MKIISLVFLTLSISILFGCEYKDALYESRLAFERDIQDDYQNLAELFNNEKTFRNQISDEDLTIVQKNLLVQKISEIMKVSLTQEENLATKLQKYYQKYNDESSRNFVRKFFITPKLKQIKEINEYMKGRFHEYKSEVLKECESDFVKHDSFELQFNTLEKYIGSQLTILQKYFRDFDEVKKKDLIIVQPYYKSLVSVLPQEYNQLGSEEESILHEYMKKMKELFPRSEWTIKAERKLVPITAKRKLKDLIGMPLLLLICTFITLVTGYYFCLKAYLKNKHNENGSSEVYKPTQSKFFMETDSIVIKDDELSERI